MCDPEKRALSESSAGSSLWFRGKKSVKGFACTTTAQALIAASELEYRFHRSVIHTVGAKVVHRLSVLARLLKAKGENSRVFLDQLIALTLSNSLFKLSNSVGQVVIASQQRSLALGGLKALVLHGDYLCAEMHELNLKFIGGRRDLRFIQRFHSSFVRGCTLGHGGKDTH